VNKKEKSWILYDWANSAYSMAVTSTILPIFFKDVASKGLSDTDSSAFWAYSNSIETVLLVLMLPILGTIADYKNMKKRFFIFFLLMGIFFTGLLSTVSEGQWFFCLFIYVLTAIGFSGSNLFYDSMLVDVTTEDRMDWVSTNGFAYGYIGSTIPFIISIALIMKPQILGFDSAIISTKLSFIITALWWFIFSIPLLKNVQQVNYLEPSTRPVKESFLRLIKTFKEIKQYKNIFLFLLAFFFYIDGVHTIISMATIFGKDINLSNTTLMVVLLVIQFVAFPFAIIYGKLAQKFSAKIMLFVGIIVYTFVTIYAYFIKSELEFWILGLLVATSQGGIQALSRSLFAKIIPKEKSAEFFGFYNIFGKFAAIFGPLLYGMASQLTENPRFGVLSLIILFIIGGVLMIFVKAQSPSKS